MENKNIVVENAGCSFGFFDLLGVAFIVLKLCGIINWSWIWVTAPIWMPLVIGLGLVIIIFIIVFICSFFED